MCSSVPAFQCLYVPVSPRSSVSTFQCSHFPVFPHFSVPTFQIFHITAFPYSSVYTFQCFHVPLFPCSSVLMFQCSHVPVFSCSSVYMFQFLFKVIVLHIWRYGIQISSRPSGIFQHCNLSTLLVFLSKRSSCICFTKFTENGVKQTDCIFHI